MRKTIIGSETINRRQDTEQGWLDLEKLAAVEVTSEDPDFPIESALTTREGSAGWRAAERGNQIICIVFDKPRAIHRIRLEFSDKENSRTQEFTLRCCRAGEPTREIVRQQWTFSPHGSTRQIEDYQVDLNDVSSLELALKPDLTPENAFATLTAWRVS
jgi:hypothetical protein